MAKKTQKILKVTSKLKVQVNTTINYHYIPTVGLEGLIFIRGVSEKEL